MNFFESKTPARVIHAKVFFITLCILFFSSQSVVDQSYAAESKEDVKQLMVRGLDAAKRSDWPSAIEQFEAAQELERYSPVILFQLALANDKAGGRELIAIPWYQAYLLAETDSERKRQVTQRVEELKAKFETDIQKLTKKTFEIAEIATERPQYYLKEALVKSAANMGNFTDALIAIGGLPSDADLDFQRQRGLDYLAGRQLNYGDSAGALDTAYKLSSARKRDGIIIRVAEEKVKRGDIEGAIEFFDDRIEEDKSFWEVRFYKKIFDKLLETNDIAGAMLVVPHFEDNQNIFNPAWRKLIKAKIADGDLSGIFQMVELLTERYPLYFTQKKMNGTYREIANKYTEAGNIVLAKKAASRMIADANRDNVYVSIFKAEFDFGLVADAQKTMALISQEYKYYAYLHIAYSQQLAGDFEGLTETIKQIGASPYGGGTDFRPLWRLSVLIESGDLARAKIAAEKLNGGFNWSNYCQIAEVHAKNNNLDAARSAILSAKSLVQDMEDPLHRISALPYIAVSQKKMGDLQSAQETMHVAFVLANAQTDFDRLKYLLPALAKKQREIGDLSGAKRSELMESRIQEWEEQTEKLKRRMREWIYIARTDSYSRLDPLFVNSYDSNIDVNEFMEKGVFHLDKFSQIVANRSADDVAYVLGDMLVIRTGDYMELKKILNEEKQ